MHAIIIDDSRTMRAIIRRIAEGLGCTSIDAADGAEALERLRQLDPDSRIDVAFVDWNMPGMDGITFVRELRADPAYAAVKILMVTTETELPRVAEALEAGANEYLMKPFTPEALADKLRLMGLEVE